MIHKQIDRLCGIKTEKPSFKELCFYLSLFFFMCNTEMRNLLSPKIDHTATIFTLIIYALLFASFTLTSKLKINKNTLTNLIFVVGFFLVYFILTYLFHPEYSNVLFGPFNIVDYVFLPTSAFWALFFFSRKADNKILLKTLFLISVTMWGLLVYEAKEVITTGVWTLMEVTLAGDYIEVNHTYNINWAYELMAADMVFLVMYYRSKNILLLIPIMTGQLLILFFGSRGAFFMFLAFWILCILFCHEDRKFGKRLIILCAICITVLALLISEKTTEHLADFIGRTGINSRTIKMLVNGEIMSDSGRSQIYGKAVSMLKEAQVFGYGIYGDRYHILDIGEIATNGYGYAHSVFLEFLISYGVIGVVILYIGIKKLIKEIIQSDNFDLKCLFLICAGCSMNLLFSSSYWYQYYFWAMIGLMIRTSRLKCN